jgi:hypothetical protein
LTKCKKRNLPERQGRIDSLSSRANINFEGPKVTKGTKGAAKSAARMKRRWRKKVGFTLLGQGSLKEDYAFLFTIEGFVQKYKAKEC